VEGGRRADVWEGGPSREGAREEKWRGRKRRHAGEGKEGEALAKKRKSPSRGLSSHTWEMGLGG
jgi:hypothetical protein